MTLSDRIIGTKVLAASGGWRCQRCGHEISRVRSGGLGLCADCRAGDREYVRMIKERS